MTKSKESRVGSLESRVELLVAALLLAVLATAALGGEPEPIPVSVNAELPARQPEISAKVEVAVEKACQWLMQNQNDDGSMKSTYPCAATALAGLAWLANGSTPYEGPYAVNINKALEYILRCVPRNGFISEDATFGASGMYGHGYATQFLAQVYGMIRNPEYAARVKEVLTKSVRVIEGCQNQFGGWNSSPNGELTDDGSGAIAVMQITALRAAESCGVPVRKQVIEKAKKYLLEMTNEQGWYAYNWHARGASSGGSIATTGAGMYMLGALNLHTDPKYTRGITNIMNNLPGKVSDMSFGGWYAYSIFYASLAIFQQGGENWVKWYEHTAKQLVESQNADGSWNDSYGGVFVALSCLTLELPYRYLPMFQEGGAGKEGE